MFVSRAQSKHQGTGRYSRAQFGHGWADTDGDCQNSRHEALIAQSTGQVRYKDGRKCQVSAGRWISPFTGAVIHDPSKMDIDHVVPLKWAFRLKKNDNINVFSASSAGGIMTTGRHN